MAVRVLTAFFDSYPAAADAIRHVEAAGVPHADISIVSNDAAHKDASIETEEHAGTATGASLGTVLGGGTGLLAGLGMLAIPGLGPVVAAGWLAATLVGAGVGAAAGGIVGSLADAGINHSDAHAYAEGVRRGGTLVTVRTDDVQAAYISELLEAEGAVDLDTREAEWRSTGWSGQYDAIAPLAGVGLDPVEAALLPGDPRVAREETLVAPKRNGRVRVYGDGI